MALEVARRLVGGLWRTVVVDEAAGAAAPPLADVLAQSGDANQGAITNLGELTMTGRAANETPFVLTSHAAQTSDLLDVIDRTGRYRLFIDKSGIVTAAASQDANETDPFFQLRDGFGGLLLSMNGLGQVSLSPQTDLGAADLIFQISDENGIPIFEVRNDGSVHIKNGTTIQADL